MAFATKSEKCLAMVDTIQFEITKAIREFVKNESLELTEGVVTEQCEDTDVCIVGIHEDLTVDTEYNQDLNERCAYISDYPFKIQISLLRVLENGKYNIKK